MLDDETKRKLAERADRLKKEIERVNRIFDKGDIALFVRNAEKKVLDLNCIEKDSILRGIEYRLKSIENEIAEKEKIEEEIRSLMKNYKRNDLLESIGSETFKFITKTERNLNDRLWLLGDTKRRRIILGEKVANDASRKLGRGEKLGRGGLRRISKLGESENYKKRLISLKRRLSD